MKKIVDERIEFEGKRVLARAGSIAYLGLWLIVAYRMYVLHQEPKAYFDILILAIGLSLYIVIAKLFKGIAGTGQQGSSLIRKIVMSFITISATLLIFYVMSGEAFTVPLIIIIVAGTVVINFVLPWASNKVIDKQL